MNLCTRRFILGQMNLCTCWFILGKMRPTIFCCELRHWLGWRLLQRLQRWNEAQRVPAYHPGGSGLGRSIAGAFYATSTPWSSATLLPPPQLATPYGPTPTPTSVRDAVLRGRLTGHACSGPGAPQARPRRAQLPPLGLLRHLQPHRGPSGCGWGCHRHRMVLPRLHATVLPHWSRPLLRTQRVTGGCAGEHVRRRSTAAPSLRRTSTRGREIRF